MGILWLSENPCSENSNYRRYVIKMLPNLVKLDNKNITSEEKLEAESVRVDNSTNDLRSDFNYANQNQNQNQNQNSSPPMGRYRTYEEMHRDRDYEDNYSNQVSRPNTNITRNTHEDERNSNM